MLNLLLVACFGLVAVSDWKRRIIPDMLIAIIVISSLLTRTRMEFYEHLIAGVVAAGVGFMLWKINQWSVGDIKLAFAVGVAFGTLTPYVALLTGVILIAYQFIFKPSKGLPLGIPVLVGIIPVALLH
jgi:Flp pilus assembly protein protease CpaA